MFHPLRRPEEILAYRSLEQLLTAKPKSVWAVGSKDYVLTAMRLMAEKNIGLVLVVEHGAIAGVLSERDCVRRLERSCVHCLAKGSVPMSLLIVLGALIFLMFVAYRGYSVILFAPIAALGAVLLTDPSLVPPVFSSVFMEKTVGFVKNYFPVFM